MISRYLLFCCGVVSCRHEHTKHINTAAPAASHPGWDRSNHERSAPLAAGRSIARDGAAGSEKRSGAKRCIPTVFHVASGKGRPHVSLFGGPVLGNILAPVQPGDCASRAAMGTVDQHARTALSTFTIAVRGKNHRSVVHPGVESTHVPDPIGQGRVRRTVGGNPGPWCFRGDSNHPVRRKHWAARWCARVCSPTACASLVGFLTALLLIPSAQAQSFDQKPRISAKFEEVTRCVEPAAQYHGVNGAVLKAILKVESSGNPLAINRNSNGTVDVGIGQINSMHFKDLARYGIVPNQLFDACTAIYVSAWHLSKQIAKWGNTWFAIGAYHSATPYYNSRYQALVNNAMVELGYVDWPKLRVPPMNAGPSGSRSIGAIAGSSKAIDDNSILAISQ